MPQNFPEIWLRRVEMNLTTSAVAPWLDGIPELDGDVTVINEGDVTEKNKFYVPTQTFEPAVLINNSTYPIEVEDYADGTTEMTLDKFVTKVTSIKQDDALGASYPKIDAATSSHTTAVSKKKYSKALHAIAPSGNTANTPVLQTTGEFVGGGTSGRRRLTYEDMVAYGKALDDIECPEEGRRWVLSSDHKEDILRDRKNFGDALVNYKLGQPAPMIAGFEMFMSVVCPVFDGTTKQPYGTAPSTGKYKASVIFYAPNIGKKTGKTYQYYAPASGSPTTQASQYNIRHYFIALPKRNKYVGAMVSAYVAP